MTERVSRREFARQSAWVAGAAGAFSIVPAHVLGGPRHTAPSDKLHIAGIGVGGMGLSNLRSLESENIVALCDVDLDYASEAVCQYPDAAVYTDYREMLEREETIEVGGLSRWPGAARSGPAPRRRDGAGGDGPRSPR